MKARERKYGEENMTNYLKIPANHNENTSVIHGNEKLIKWESLSAKWLYAKCNAIIKLINAGNKWENENVINNIWKYRNENTKKSCQK